ncbi:MAG TPA: DUF494 family protein [Ignavibacteriaceae bacterium]|nr:DUF494 family protein [Ignavibacteriaceae bacterium]
MTANIIEVLAKLAEGMNKKVSPEDLAEDFSRENKYKINLIAAAYSWIYEKIARDMIENKLHKRTPSMGLRILSEKEIMILGKENYNYLLYFYNKGLLNNNDIDIIVEEAGYFEGNISREELNVLILSLFLNLDHFILPGSRLMLHSSDTIN